MLQLLAADVAVHTSTGFLLGDDGEAAARAILVEGSELTTEGVDRVVLVEGDGWRRGVEHVGWSAFV